MSETFDNTITAALTFKVPQKVGLPPIHAKFAQRSNRHKGLNPDDRPNLNGDIACWIDEGPLRALNGPWIQWQDDNNAPCATIDCL